MSSLLSILASYGADPADFESRRDEIHALGPAAMKDVLAAALDPQWTEALDLLVTCMADVQYPPALPHMRRWMEHDDAECIGIPAASAIDQMSGNHFDVLRFYSGDWAELPATLQAIGAWWDAGKAKVQSEAEWLAKELAKRAKQIADVPPPAPNITQAEHDAMRPDLIDMVRSFRALPTEVQHRLEHEALMRVLPIYERAFIDGTALRHALRAVERFINTAANAEELLALRDEVEQLVRDANQAAGYNPAHHRYQNPTAKAAAEVAQGVLYCISPDPRNRLQGLHYARNAIDYAGGGATAVAAELTRQRTRVMDSQ